MSSYRQCLTLAVLFLLPAFVARGQATSGNITGTVVDSSGAALQSAKITITDLDRGTVSHIETNGDGNFSQTHLLAGHYRVTVENPGFSTLSQNATVEVDA